MSKWLSLVGVLLGLGVVACPVSACRCCAAEIAGSAADEKYEKIEAALRSPTTLEFMETPLSDVVEYVKKLHRIDIRSDLKSLKEVGVSPETPISCNLKGVTLQSALKLMFRGLDVLCTANQGVLLVTTPETAVKQVVTRRHVIEDVLRPNVNPVSARARGDALIRFVSAAYAPQAWQPRGGRGSLSLDPAEAPRFLVVEQSADVQGQIVRLLDQLRSVARIPASLPAANRAWNSHSTQNIRAQLNGLTTLEVHETPLCDVIEYLKDLHKIEIQLDCWKVYDTGVSPDRPVTLTLKGVPLRTALRVMLHDQDSRT